jgi:hypothetical protein
MLLWVVHVVCLKKAGDKLEIWVINPLEKGSLEDREREVTYKEILDWDVQGSGSYRCRWILY